MSDQVTVTLSLTQARSLFRLASLAQLVLKAQCESGCEAEASISSAALGRLASAIEQQEVIV